MIHVIAIVTTQPGQRDAVLQAFEANVPNVRAEVGFIEYGAVVDSSPALKFQTEFGQDTIVVIEKWESVEALKAHSTAPHMVAYAGKTHDLVASRVIHVLVPVCRTRVSTARFGRLPLAPCELGDSFKALIAKRKEKPSP